MTAQIVPRHPLGSSGLSISRLGLGGWAFGGPGWPGGWGAQDERDTTATIHHAMSSGVNWVDVAPVYGLGHAEEVVGRALRTLPADERPYVFTKCGLAWDAAALAVPGGRVGRRDSIAREVKASLRRLAIDHIDMYQMHWPAQDGTPIEEYWSQLAELRADGVVRAIGLSNHGVDELTRAQAIATVDVCQSPFSLLRRDAADIVEWCHTNGVAVLAYSPLESGLLVDANSGRQLPADDWRANDQRFSPDGVRAVAGLTDVLAVVAARHGVTISAVALAWVLRWDGISAAIVGARRPDQIDGWRTAPAVALSPGDLNRIDSALQSHGLGTGPHHPPSARTAEDGVLNEPGLLRPTDR